MDDDELRYISDERGEVTGVIVPIALWREIAAELETHHFLKSAAMRRRLLEAKARSEGLALGEVFLRFGIDEAESR